MKIDLRDVETYYINLDRHPEKNESMVSLIDSFGFNNITRVSGVDRPDSSIIGCASSHVNILSDASAPTIILEDDCEIFHNNPVIEVPDDADAVYLGLSSWALNVDSGSQWVHSFNLKKDCPSVFKVNNMLATHAILYLNKDYMDMCLRAGRYSADSVEHIDVSFARFQRFFNVYALAKPTFYQSSNTPFTKITLGDIRLKNFRG